MGVAEMDSHDFYVWVMQTVEQLREGHLAEVNMEDVIEALKRAARGVEPDLQYLVDQYGPDLAREQRRFRRKKSPIRARAFISKAKRFCDCANGKIPNVSGFREAGKTLKAYRKQEKTLSTEDARLDAARKLANKISRELGCVPMCVTADMKGHNIYFTLERDARASIDGWWYLAQLVEQQVAFQRFKICVECGVLFYDASPPENRTACSTQCKNRYNQRNARARRRSEETSE